MILRSRLRVGVLGLLLEVGGWRGETHCLRDRATTFGAPRLEAGQWLLFEAMKCL